METGKERLREMHRQYNRSRRESPPRRISQVGYGFKLDEDVDRLCEVYIKHEGIYYEPNERQREILLNVFLRVYVDAERQRREDYYDSPNPPVVEQKQFAFKNQEKSS